MHTPSLGGGAGALGPLLPRVASRTVDCAPPILSPVVWCTIMPQTVRYPSELGQHVCRLSLRKLSQRATSNAALRRAYAESSCRMLTQPCGCFLYVSDGAIIDRGARHHRVVAARHLLVLREAPDAISICKSQAAARAFAAASGGLANQHSIARKALWHTKSNQVAHVARQQVPVACPASWLFWHHSKALARLCARLFTRLSYQRVPGSLWLPWSRWPL